MLPIVLPLEVITSIIQYYWLNDPTNDVYMLYTVAITLLVYPIYQAALLLGISQALSGKYLPAQALWRTGLKYWLPILLVNMLFYAGVIAGMFLLIIPGIFLAVRWSLAEQHVVLDSENPFQALSSSLTETSGHFWTVCFGMLIIALGMFLIAWPMQSILGDLTNNSPIALFFPSLIQSLMYPIFVIFLLRVRHFLRFNE
jgi:uncharacterized membrane protein YedE/YeeE